MKKHTLHNKLKTATMACLLALPASGAFAQSHTYNWWNGKGLVQGSGNPVFDARKALEDGGLKLSGKYGGAFYGVLESEGGSRGFWDEEIAFGGELNFGKVLKSNTFDGFKGFGTFRWRQDTPDYNPNNFVEAQSMFQPSHWQSGTQFRVLNFGLEYSSLNNLPVKDMIIAKGGWVQPQREFIQQPLSKLFMNNAIESAKGVGGNIPFSSSVSTWGGTLEIKPHESIYVKNGLFMSYPEASNTDNHGLAFRGYSPQPWKNGYWYMGELGYTPKFGESELEGKYAFGGYFYETPPEATRTWSNNYVDGRYGFYFQADQMLYREETVAPNSTKKLAMRSRELNKQGLHTFNLISMAPGYARSNNFPFYFQSGLVYTGLLPGRNADQAMVAFGYGAYEQNVGNPPKTSTSVLEAGYRYQLNGWAFVQPFFQYISNPAGTGKVDNAAVLGFTTGFAF